MRRHLEGIDLATTHALLRRATVIDDFAVHSNAATTHALLRRTTTALLNAWRNNLCYNSRSPAENDGMCYTLMTRDNTRYNSRSLLRRATPLAVEPLDDALATTHALLRRATADVCVVAGAMGATTHALLRRATQHGTFLLFVLWCYNSRSPAESDVIERSIFTLSNRYNSRSPAESDISPAWNTFACRWLQLPLSPAESDIYNAIVRQLS